MHARAVGQSRVDERRREIDASSEWRDQPLDQDQDLVGIGEADAGLLESAIALDPYAARAVHHHLAHALVTQERRERREPEQPVFEPPLEIAQLAGRHDDALR